MTSTLIFLADKVLGKGVEFKAQISIYFSF